MSEADVSSDHAERVLGHAIPGIRAIYDWFAFAAEKAEALNRLAALIKNIVKPPPDNVVALAQRKRRARSARSPT
jgi:hypothetical protein